MQRHVTKFFLVLILITTTMLGCKQDSAGGGDPWAAYKVDPLTLPAFKEHLQDIMNNLQSQESAASTQASSFRALRYMTYKSWYVASRELGSIEKQSLGVSFNKDETQQIALQTQNEIWINKDIFEAMSLREQADLLIHEFVMNLYFLKYKSISELCLLSTENSAKAVCDQYKTFDAVYPGQAPAPLNAVDYQNIRRVTSFFIQLGSTASLPMIRQALEENDFDSRLFAEGADLREINKTQEFSANELKGMLERTEISGQALERCKFIKLNRDLPCRLSYEQVSKPDQGTGILLPYLQLRITDPQGAQKFADFSVMNSYLRKLHATKSFDPLRQKYFWLVPIIESATNPQVGDIQTQEFLILIEEEGSPEFNLRLHSILHVPVEILSIERSPHGKYLRCQMRRPKANTWQTDQLIVSVDQRHDKYLIWFGQNTPLFSFCGFLKE